MKITAKRVAADFDATDLENPIWHQAEPGLISKYWSGEDAPAGRHVELRLLWSDTALYVRFDAAQAEPFNLNPEPNLDQKTIGLWDFDVCEIFLAPNSHETERYFEFEVSPTGEWIDLGIRQLPDRRETDWAFISGMKAMARIGGNATLMTIEVPWLAFGKRPKPNDAWRVNLFRCVGVGESRGYLAWSPTMTPAPNFHVPDRFGELIFGGQP